MAKPFQFKLEKVLDYRGQLEEQAKGVLASAQEAYDTQAAVVENLTNQMAAHLSKEAESQKSPNACGCGDSIKRPLSRICSGRGWN